MNDFLSGIGFMAIMAAIIYFFVQHDDKKRDKIIENEKLFSHIGGDDDLDNTLPKKECGIGYFLTSEWDIISRFDNNFTKWMDAHPNREDRESAEKRRKEMINRRVEDLSKYYK